MEENKVSKLKKQIFQTIQIGAEGDTISRAFDYFIVTVIFLNIAVMFLQTFEELAFASGVMYAIEVVTILIFCVEYLLRIWTADLLYPEKSKRKAIGRFLISYDGVVDLLTILPFFVFSGFVVFRMLRVVRVFHLFRINKKVDSFNVIKEVLFEKKNQIASSVMIILILMLASSIGMYHAEHEAQPEAFRNAFSGIWWAVSAILTVGYGDIYPITTAGKIMAIITAFLGVGAVAIPTGIMSAGFVEQYTRIKNKAALGEEISVPFVTISVSGDHLWRGLPVKDAKLPKGLSMALILRGDDVIAPRGDILIEENDRILLAAEKLSLREYDEMLKEVTIGEQHPWVNQQIQNLDISRLTTIVAVRHKNKVIVPNGQTRICAGDRVITFTKQTE